ncbi:tyrosine-type recombinase/integrase [Listeria sp. FSL L7-0083]|uniref:tyrosine-type recombinase/integrase n=1 Tax=Listeria farberi TaxID=2713500 RepID=UPI0016293D53|nr:tyrosine-type recombinase/integrase [Listeria farberi]MBC2267726.1 tyrosine-type recombinase/integrase [Listeria farberi]
MRKKELTQQELALLGEVSVYSDEEVVEMFIKSRYIKNVRPSTLKFYEVGLHTFRRSLDDLSIEKRFTEITAPDIHCVIELWMTRLKTTSINSKLSCIRAFYNFLYEQRLTATNVAEKVHKLRVRRKIYETLERNEIKLIVREFKKKNTFRAFRNLTIFQLLLDTGIRINECLHIKVDDVHEDYIVITETKNLSQRVVYLSGDMVARLKIYIKVRGQLATPFLFVNIENERLRSRTFQEHLKSITILSGVKKNVSPHMCRRTYAKQAVLAGIDPFSLASLLGHNSIEVTKQYVQLWGSDLKNQAKLKADYGDIFK